MRLFRSLFAAPLTLVIICTLLGSAAANISSAASAVATRTASPNDRSLGITLAKETPTVTVVIDVVGAGVVDGSLEVTALVKSPTGSSAAPTGTVQFFDGGTPLTGAVPITFGAASAVITFSSVGQQSVTGVYSGDANYNSADSAPVAISVNAPFGFNPAAPQSQTIPAGGTATYNVGLLLVGNTSFSGPVSLTCAGAPSNAICAVSPNAVTLDPTNSSVGVTVTVSNTASARLIPHSLKTLLFFAAVLAMAGASLGTKPKGLLLWFCPALLILGLVACGGKSAAMQPPTIATLTVTATSGSIIVQKPLTLTITH